MTGNIAGYVLPEIYDHMQTNSHTPYGYQPGADSSESLPSFGGDYGINFGSPGSGSVSQVPEGGRAALLLAGLALIDVSMRCRSAGNPIHNAQ